MINQSAHYPPVHPRLIQLTNLTTLKETWSIIAGAEACILCASSLACFATKLFPKDRIWLKGGHDHMFSEWATYFYHGPHTITNEVIFRNFDVLKKYTLNTGNNIPMTSNPQSLMLDQGQVTLL